jgi:hypothetical protein
MSEETFESAIADFKRAFPTKQPRKHQFTRSQILSHCVVHDIDVNVILDMSTAVWKREGEGTPKSPNMRDGIKHVEVIPGPQSGTIGYGESDVDSKLSSLLQDEEEMMSEIMINRLLPLCVPLEAFSAMCETKDCTVSVELSTHPDTSLCLQVRTILLKKW